MALTAFTSNPKVSISVQAQCEKAISGVANNAKNEVQLSISESFTYGSGASQFNEVISAIRTIAAGATENLDLSGAITNILNDASVTLTKIKAIMIELLSSAQDSTNGTACTQITLGGHATNPWIGGPLGATDTYKIGNGEKWLHVDPSAAGFTVTAGTGDLIKIVNNDGAVAAAYRITIFGVN